MEAHQHFILHKPYGYLSQLVTNQTSQRKKRLLSELYNFPEGTMAIGRLDYDSEGLILLSTSGKVSQFIRARKIEKEYYVQLDGIISEDALEQLRTGVNISIEGKLHSTLPAKCIPLSEIPELPERSKPIRGEHHGPTSWASITITEGKFRQVRKMFAVVGFPVLRLVRVRIGNIHLRDIKLGEVREVEWFEV